MNTTDGMGRADLDATFEVTADSLDRLHERLVRDAARDGLLDVAYRTVDSPLGPLLMATTERGLVRIAYEREGFDDVLGRLSDRVSPRILRSARPLDTAALQLDEYFAGRRQHFDLTLDHAMSSGFRRTVQEALPTIAYGDTSTYGAIAALVGNPRAVRAVGTACATNPLPLVQPCHRVLRSDGSLGRYVGGDDAKSTLLELERAA